MAARDSHQVIVIIESLKFKLTSYVPLRFVETLGQSTEPKAPDFCQKTSVNVGNGSTVMIHDLHRGLRTLVTVHVGLEQLFDGLCQCAAERRQGRRIFLDMQIEGCGMADSTGIGKIKHNVSQLAWFFEG
jgi:hypothetical protein